MTDMVMDNVLMAPLYHLELVRDRDVPYDGNAGTTVAAAQVLHNLLDRSPVEQMAVLYLNSGAKIIGAEKVGMGGMEQVSANPTEIFRGAIVKAVPEILIAHNHPDGYAHPSQQDINFTVNLINVGALLGIRVRDHIIIGNNAGHYSIRENTHVLHDMFLRAEKELLGFSANDLKEKLLKLLGGGHTHSVPEKKPGDPTANSESDWKDSLSYRALNLRY